MLSYAMLCRVVSYYVMLCFVVLRYAKLCYAMAEGVSPLHTFNLHLELGFLRLIV